MIPLPNLCMLQRLTQLARSSVLALVALPLLGGHAIAQDEATTLAGALRSADVVVRATVQAATDPSPEWHRLQFVTTELLTGTLGPQFSVLEPAGACCGRSLFALQPGSDVLLFLRRTGTTLHPFGGARGVLPADGELLAHLRALLAAADEPARLHVLAQALQATEPRIAADAAHALAVAPTLTLSAGDRAEIVAALQSAAVRGATTAAPLLDAALRLSDPTVLDAALPVYLTAERDDMAALLRRGFARVDAGMLAARLAQHAAGDERSDLRMTDLLADLPAAQGTPLLRRMFAATSNPRVQLCAAEHLLGRRQLDGALASRMQPSLLRLAERRAQSANRYRSIDVNR